MSKIRLIEGKAISNKCDACGFSEVWCGYKWCPMCGNTMETQPEDDEDGTEIEWPEEIRFLCITFDCKNNDGTGICKVQNEIDFSRPSCEHYERR